MHRDNGRQGMRAHGPDIRIIAAAAVITAAAVSGSCLFGTATNLCEQYGRRCDPGQICAANQNICIDISGCGDGIIERDKGEVCDDGNITDGDGCSANCKSLETCGNGIQDINETCDDGNTVSGDGCNAMCQLEMCGNGVYNPASEECDTGEDTQACNGSGAADVKCKIPRCGDGYQNAKFTPFMAFLPEQCDKSGSDQMDCNGNNNGSEGPGSCRIPLCGDGYANKTYTPPGAIGTEQCDEIDLTTQPHFSIDTPHCNSNNAGPVQCRAPICGDGYINKAFHPTTGGPAETCDNGAANTPECNGNGAGSVQCQPAACGDGYINNAFHPTTGGPAETCDNGSADTPECNGSGAGPVQCQPHTCGDGHVNPQFTPRGASKPEDCDVGNPGKGIPPVSCNNGSGGQLQCNSLCNCV